MRLLLDTDVLGMVCHPRANRALAQWIEGMLTQPESATRLVLPAIADYELRRKLIHLAKYKGQREARESLARLDGLVELLEFQPLDAETTWRAADLWAEARGRGQSTAAVDALDGDVILAAQARQTDGAVVTTNTRHLERFVTVYRWEDLAGR